MIAAAVLGLIGTLLLTILVEVAVAAAFRVGRRGIQAVVLVNLVTNPLFNLTLVGMAKVPQSLPAVALMFGSLELAVVLVEWRLLVWALGTATRRGSRLLAMSIVMNVASALVGVLSYVGFVLLVFAASILRR